MPFVSWMKMPSVTDVTWNLSNTWHFPSKNLSSELRWRGKQTLKTSIIQNNLHERKCKNDHTFALLLSIRKDPRTRQYYTELQMSTNTTYLNVVTDLGGSNTWWPIQFTIIPPGPLRIWPPQGLGLRELHAPRPGCGNNTCGSNVYNLELALWWWHWHRQNDIIDWCPICVDWLWLHQ